ncbi:MAG: hypothetical protein ACRDZ7_09975 [Acidimicrobiia bacterium]
MQLTLVGIDAVVGPGDGIVVGPAEPAATGEFLDLGLGRGEVLAGAGDAAVEPLDVSLVCGDDVAHGRELGAEPLQAAEFGASVGAGAGFDVVAGLFQSRRRVAGSSPRSSSSRRVSVAERSADDRRRASARTSTGSSGRWRRR